MLSKQTTMERRKLHRKRQHSTSPERNKYRAIRQQITFFLVVFLISHPLEILLLKWRDFGSTKDAQKERRMAITNRTFDLCVELLLDALCLVLLTQANEFFSLVFKLFAEANGMWMMDYSVHAVNWYNFWFLSHHIPSSSRAVFHSEPVWCAQ